LVIFWIGKGREGGEKYQLEQIEIHKILNEYIENKRV
jgi:hypothetical protein